MAFTSIAFLWINYGIQNYDAVKHDVQQYFMVACSNRTKALSILVLLLHFLSYTIYVSFATGREERAVICYGHSSIWPENVTFCSYSEVTICAQKALSSSYFENPTTTTQSLWQPRLHTTAIFARRYSHSVALHSLQNADNQSESEDDDTDADRTVM